MKTIVIDLNRVSSSEEINMIISSVINDSPDIVVFTNYKRNMQEKVFHPIFKQFNNPKAEINEAEGLLVIMNGETGRDISMEINKFPETNQAFITIDF